MNVLQHTRNELNLCLKQNRPDRSYRDTLLNSLLAVYKHIERWHVKRWLRDIAYARNTETSKCKVKQRLFVIDAVIMQSIQM